MLWTTRQNNVSSFLRLNFAVLNLEVHPERVRGNLTNTARYHGNGELLLFTNRKSHTGFPLIGTKVGDLE